MVDVMEINVFINVKYNIQISTYVDWHNYHILPCVMYNTRIPTCVDCDCNVNDIYLLIFLITYKVNKRF